MQVSGVTLGCSVYVSRLAAEVAMGANGYVVSANCCPLCDLISVLEAAGAKVSWKLSTHPEDLPTGPREHPALS